MREALRGAPLVLEQPSSGDRPRPPRRREGRPARRPRQHVGLGAFLEQFGVERQPLRRHAEADRQPADQRDVTAAPQRRAKIGGRSAGFAHDPEVARLLVEQNRHPAAERRQRAAEFAAADRDRADVGARGVDRDMDRRVGRLGEAQQTRRDFKFAAEPYRLVAGDAQRQAGALAPQAAGFEPRLGRAPDRGVHRHTSAKTSSKRLSASSITASVSARLV